MASANIWYCHCLTHFWSISGRCPLSIPPGNIKNKSFLFSECVEIASIWLKNVFEKYYTQKHYPLNLWINSQNNWIQIKHKFFTIIEIDSFHFVLRIPLDANFQSNWHYCSTHISLNVAVRYRILMLATLYIQKKGGLKNSFQKTYLCMQVIVKKTKKFIKVQY